MLIAVRLFASIRERAGTSHRQIELPAGSHVADVWPVLDLGAEPSGLAYAVNRSYADRGAELFDGDEVALIPPVSGGGALVSASLSSEPLNLGALVARVSQPRAGGIASFVGTVRDRSRGRIVQWLEYEAYDDMALLEMERIAALVADEHGCLAAAIAHRTGRVEIGEASVMVAIAAEHRAGALAACAQAIDTLKTTVPIWKKELYEGGEEWIGQGS